MRINTLGAPLAPIHWLDRQAAPGGSTSISPRVVGKRRVFAADNAGDPGDGSRAPRRRLNGSNGPSPARAISATGTSPHIDAACRLADHTGVSVARTDAAARARQPNGLWFYVPYTSPSFPLTDAAATIRMGPTQTSTRSSFMSLPTELQLLILGQTDVQSLLRAAGVNRHLQALASTLLRSPPWPHRVAKHLGELPEANVKKRGAPFCLRPRHPLAGSTFPMVDQLELHPHTDLSRLHRLMPNISSVHGLGRPLRHDNWNDVVSTLRRCWPSIYHFTGRHIVCAALSEMAADDVSIRRLGCIKAHREHYADRHSERIEEWLYPMLDRLGPWIASHMRHVDAYPIFDVAGIEEIHIKLPLHEPVLFSSSPTTLFNARDIHGLCTTLRDYIDRHPPDVFRHLEAAQECMRTLGHGLQTYFEQWRLPAFEIETCAGLRAAFSRISLALVQQDQRYLDEILQAILSRLTKSDAHNHLRSLKLTIMPAHTAFISAFKPLNPLKSGHSSIGVAQHVLFSRAAATPDICAGDVLMQIWRRAPNFELTMAYEEKHILHRAAQGQNAQWHTAGQWLPPHTFDPEVVFAPRGPATHFDGELSP